MTEDVNTDKLSKEEKLSRQDKALLGLAGLLSFIINIFATYFTVKISWNVFLVKIFPLPLISFPQILAVILVIGFIRFNVTLNSFVRKDEKFTPAKAIKTTGTIIGTYAFYLLCLWIITTML